jgi:hypothetical protein
MVSPYAGLPPAGEPYFLPPQRRVTPLMPPSFSPLPPTFAPAPYPYLPTAPAVPSGSSTPFPRLSLASVPSGPRLSYASVPTPPRLSLASEPYGPRLSLPSALSSPGPWQGAPSPSLSQLSYANPTWIWPPTGAAPSYPPSAYGGVAPYVPAAASSPAASHPQPSPAASAPGVIHVYVPTYESAAGGPAAGSAARPYTSAGQNGTPSRTESFWGRFPATPPSP